QEMVLQEALAISSMWTQGNREEVRPAILRGLEIANRLGATAHRLRLMTGLHVHLVRIGEFEEASDIAHELDAVARSTADSSCVAMSTWILGSACHFLGNPLAARRHLEAGFACGGARNAQQFGLDYRVRALVIFARVLWLSGCADRAVDVA